MPQSRIGDRCLRFLNCAQGDKIEAAIAYLFREIWVGNDGDVVTPAFQVRTELNHGVHVTGTAKGGEQDVEGS